MRLHSPFGLLSTHPIPPIDAVNNKHRTVLQNRNRFAFLIDAAIWCRILTAVHNRQARLGQLLPEMHEVNKLALLQVLSDKTSTTLPIYRTDPADPDDENTLATALFAIKETGVEFEVRQQGELRFKTFILQATSARASSQTLRPA